jgi:hypothetical protein
VNDELERICLRHSLSICEERLEKFTKPLRKEDLHPEIRTLDTPIAKQEYTSFDHSVRCTGPVCMYFVC